MKKVVKKLAGPGYLHSKDGSGSLWHFLVSLYIYKYTHTHTHTHTHTQIYIYIYPQLQEKNFKKSLLSKSKIFSISASLLFFDTGYHHIAFKNVYTRWKYPLEYLG